jgi:hypothetical protein
MRGRRSMICDAALVITTWLIMINEHSKIPWYLETNSQEENAFASF